MTFILFFKRKPNLCVRDEIVLQCDVPMFVGKFSTSQIFSQSFEIAAAANWLMVSTLPTLSLS